jgi:adenylyltransferase/sulfurtransferase
MLSPAERLRYSRQIILPELKIDGQERLAQGKVLVIGAGGLGSPVLYYLTAAGIGTLGIVDFDRVSESNLQRQILYGTKDTGQLKASTAATRLSDLNPHVRINLHECAINSENALDIIQQYDVVVDGSDNLPTRYLVNDACVMLGKVLIYGAIFQFEGQVSVFNALRSDGSRGPNYRDLFPEPPPPEMVPSCNEGGVLGVLPGIIGSMQANEAIKVVAGIGKLLSGRLLVYDSLDLTVRFLNIQPQPSNPISGTNPSIKKLIDYEAFCSGAPSGNQIKEIEPKALKDLIESGAKIQVIDVREPFEFELVNLNGINIPLASVSDQIHLIQREGTVVVHCKSGGRSKTAIRLLQEKFGFNNLVNLKGGILQWIDEVNPAGQRY